jgi:predicted house-cleaning NTP pyrophosphatase (Maf/HAM1 superfamily)
VALVLVDNNNNNNNNSSQVRLVESFTDTATVQFAALTEADIAAYVASGEPMDKAGSYGIQGIGGQLVTSIEGDFFTVSSAA